jgi:ferredoxin
MVRVWIDQDACTSSTLCELAVPDVFMLSEEDDLAYVKQDGKVLPGRGAQAKAEVSDHLVDAVADTAKACPGVCIYLEGVPE